MKFIAKITQIAAFALVCAGGLFAGSIDALSNQSADYTRTFSRNASVDTDAAVYNPAGTAFMQPGLHLQISNQSVFKTYQDDLSIGSATYDKSYKSTEPTLLLPNGAVVYNGKNWAAFLAAGVLGGGGTAVYNDGVPFMVFTAASIGAKFTAGYGLPSGNTVWTGTGNLTATSIFPQATLGGSYAFTDWISASLGVRYVYALKTYKGSATYYTALAAKTTTLNLDAQETAQGFGAILGLDVKPLPELLIALRVETPTSLQFKTSVSTGNDFGGMFVDGKTHQKDLPAMIGLGASYNWDQFTFTSSFDGYFIGFAGTYPHSKAGSIYVDGYDDSYSPFGFEISGSCEYRLIPHFLSLSAGYMFDKVGGNSKTYNDFDFSLDSHSVGAGAKVTPLSNLDITLGLSHTFYLSSNGEGTFANVNYKKDATVIALAANYKLF